MKKRAILIGVLISIILCYFLLRAISFNDLFVTFARLSFFSFTLAFLLYVFVYLLRTVRFMTLLDGRIRFFKLFFIVSLHNLATVVFPFRTGEVSYVYLTKKEGVNASEGIASLLLSRLFDFIAVFLIFVLGYFYLGNFSRDIGLAFVWFSFFTVGLFLFVLSIVRFKLRLKVIFERLLSLFSLGDNRAIRYIQQELGYIVDAFRSISSRRVLIVTLFQSLALWLIMFVFTYYVLTVFGLSVSFLEAIVGGSIALAISLLPIQGALGFGTTEAALTIAFLLLGFEKELIISVGFGYHILSLVFTFLVGGYGFFWYFRRRKDLTRIP